MHPNRIFRWDDAAAMLAMVGDIGFARLFLMTPDGPRVAHAPVIVTEAGTLRFHLANGNALTKYIEGATVLALIEGPNAYVSANWYVDIAGAVPTWNYVAIECDGTVNTLDRDALIALLDTLSRKLEPDVGEDWTRAKMDPARFDAMLGAITAYELTIGAIRGTRKLSQNKSDAEVASVLRGMDATGADAMAKAMRAIRP